MAEEIEEEHAVAGLRTALADLPDDTHVVCLDEGTGDVFEIGEVATISSAEGPILVLSLRKVDGLAANLARKDGS